MGEILVGTSSWTDKSLLSSGWYPKGVSSAEERLRYYASNFPIVEVDSTYYFPPSEQNSELWVERTPKGFVFNIKAFSLLTQHPTKPDALYKDLSRPDTDKKNIYLNDLDPKDVDEVWDRFLSALTPLHDAGKLGALLFQFPPWFHISKRNRDYILDCARRAAPMVVCVEFRNESWMSEDNQSKTLDFLEGHGIPYVSVDMPQGFKTSIPPVAATTADLAVVRFHGRNSAEWNSKSVQRRFRYDYSEGELSEWTPRLRQVANDAKTTHVMMNNCYRDYAQRNASELADLLRREDLVVPGPPT
ncbi:MAG: DUF72 domain-containing protein [Actinobacteria bacterium]|nr:DUF72 domain-containing protein [Actinomycetota bacterium]